jgi:NADH dehydrogenase
VTQGAELLTPLHKTLQENALRIIRDKGIRVMLNTKVKEVTKEGILTESGEMLASPHVVWAAGVKAQYPELVGNFTADPSGRIPVSTYLQMHNYKNVFVLGDSALLLQDGKPIPMLAQVAVEQAPYVAHNIAQSIRGKALEAFRYESKGELVSLGRGNAVARIFGITFSGVVAWFIWRTIYLFKFLSGSKRIKIAVDWTVDLFYPRDITKA